MASGSTANLETKRHAPEIVSPDIVIPLHRQDDTNANRNISIEYTMVFDDILAAEKLHNALWELLERPGWRKLGARLRLNSHGKLEYHVPAQYTKERPPVNFTQETHNIPISQHPIGAQFPRANGSLQVFGGVELLRELTVPKYNPSRLDDWIHTDRAQLSLHIVSFSDTTLVTLIWLHTLLDAMGRQALLKAWTTVLEGQEPPEFWGYDFDPLEHLGAPQTSPIAMDVKSEGKVPPELSRKMVQNERPVKHHTLVLPPSFFARLRTSAYLALSSLPPMHLTMNTSTSDPFLSNGDILCAWLSRLIALSTPSLSSPSLPKTSTPKPLLLINVLGLRAILSTPSDGYDTLIPKEKAYIGNCTMGVPSLFSAPDFANIPLGHIAAQLRRDLVRQGTREAVEDAQRRGREAAMKEASQGAEPEVFVFTNWEKARLFQVDFSSAVIKARDGGGRGGSADPAYVCGKPRYIHVYGTDQRVVAVSGLGNCVGRDHAGNYWLGAVMKEEVAGKFVEVVEGLVEGGGV